MLPELPSVGLIVLSFFALFVGSFAKGITGMGLPLLAVPILAGFMGVERAVIIMVVPSLITNAWLMWRTRRAVRLTRNLPLGLVAGVIGATLGSWLLAVLDDRILILTLVVLVAVYLLTRVLKLEYTVSPRASRILSPIIGLAAGVSQGSAGISGLFFASYFHALRLEPTAFVFSTAAMFMSLSLGQAMTLSTLGLMTSDRLMESTLALIPVFAALPFSVWCSRFINRRLFDRIVLAMLILTEIKLIHNALS